jgi:hypothetical protein
MNTPTCRIRSGYCARATIGHAAALPSPAMNSRLRIGRPSSRFIGSLSRPRMHGNGRRYAVRPYLRDDGSEFGYPRDCAFPTGFQSSHAGQVRVAGHESCSTKILIAAVPRAAKSTAKSISRMVSRRGICVSNGIVRCGQVGATKPAGASTAMGHRCGAGPE